METFFRHIPEVLEDDDAAGEAERASQILKVRDAIARRWVALKTIGTTWHRSEIEEVLEQTKGTISDLITIHGPEIPFAPDPDLAWLGIDVVDTPMQQDAIPKSNHSNSGKSQRSAVSSSGSTSSVVAHEFKFLRTKAGVWSCLQVSHWKRLFRKFFTCDFIEHY